MFTSQQAVLGSLQRPGRMGRLGDLIQMDTSQMMVPVLIPQTTTPAVTGLNSNWLIAGSVAAALLASWGIFGSKVGKAAPVSRGPRKPKKAVKARK